MKLESIPKGKNVIQLFDNFLKEEKTQDCSYTEYLMSLEGLHPSDYKITKEKAEVIVVVDNSGSMSGTPWKQVQSALIKMLEITNGTSIMMQNKYPSVAHWRRISC